MICHAASPLAEPQENVTPALVVPSSPPLPSPSRVSDHFTSSNLFCPSGPHSFFPPSRGAALNLSRAAPDRRSHYCRYRSVVARLSRPRPRPSPCLSPPPTRVTLPPQGPAPHMLHAQKEASPHLTLSRVIYKTNPSVSLLPTGLISLGGPSLRAYQWLAIAT